MRVSAGASSLAASFSSLPGMLSGPVALLGLISFRSLTTPPTETVILGTSGVSLCPRSGKSPGASCEKTEANCLLRRSALVILSLYVIPSFLRGATPHLSVFRLFM